MKTFIVTVFVSFCILSGVDAVAEPAWQTWVRNRAKMEREQGSLKHLLKCSELRTKVIATLDRVNATWPRCDSRAWADDAIKAIDEWREAGCSTDEREQAEKDGKKAEFADMILNVRPDLTRLHAYYEDCSGN